MKCFDKITGKVIAENLQMKDSYFGRLIGLLSTKSLPLNTGIVLKPCQQIHTFFMRFNIDVIFLDKDQNVLLVLEDFPPWRVSPFLRKSVYTIELASGSLKGTIKKGQQLSFSL